MGYSGQNGDPTLDDLITKLETISYYSELFTFAFGDNIINQDRIEKALAQFLRSIQSYDSKFDDGMAAVGGDQFQDFPNFIVDENAGKTLFITDAITSGGARTGGGTGCFHCHDSPNFHFIIEKKNNGVITEINGSEVFDISIAPTLRDGFGPDGTLNGPLFHNGQATTFDELLDHYNDVLFNSNRDTRIDINGTPLNLTNQERLQLEVFIKTLTGSDIYTNEKWSDPFDTEGNIAIINNPLPIELVKFETQIKRKTVVLE